MTRTLFAPKRTFLLLAALCVCIFIILNLQIAAPFIHSLADIDKSIMITLNHDGGVGSDHFWKTISSNMAWVPVGLALIASLVYNKKSLLFSVLPVVRGISSGFKIIILTVLIAGGAAFLFPVKEETENE